MINNNPQLTQYVESFQNLLEYFEKNPHIFRDGIEPITLSDYLLYFEKRSGTKFFVMPCTVYKTPILEKYKEQIVQTWFTFNQNGVSNSHTLVQFSPTFHGLFVYEFAGSQEILMYNTMYTSDQRNVLDFVRNNKEFEVKDHISVAFNGNPPGFAASSWNRDEMGG
jgi:hypothetical protein